MGISISFVMNKVGGPWLLTFSLFLLLPISFLLGRIQSRWYCLAYSVPSLYGLYRLSLLVGIPAGCLVIPYRQFVFLVGLLHIAEGLMVYWAAPKAMISIKGYKGKEKVEGYQTHLSWFVPLFLFSCKAFFIPIFMAYGDDTTSSNPKKRFKNMGIWIFCYGIGMVQLGWLLINKAIKLELGLALMPLCHEILMLINKRMEVKNK